jgi:type IV pilus assembly protein PilN
MIKINLLEVEKERRAKKSMGGGPKAAAGPVPTGILAIGIIGLGIAALGFTYFSTKSKLANLEADVKVKRARKAELEPYIKRVDELEKRRDELKRKNEAIEQLRSQRTIPVHILDEVSRALPEYLWLTQLVIKGETLAIDGETLQEQAIPTFMKSLEASEFIGPCSLILTQQKTSGGPAGNVSTTFKISAPITNPFKPKVTEEAKPTPGKKKK